jgi:hypothetical protein
MRLPGALAALLGGLLLPGGAACAARHAATPAPAPLAKKPSAKTAPKAKATPVALVMHDIPPHTGDDIAEHAAAIAAGLEKPPMRHDCSGFIFAAYAAAGEPLTIPDRYAGKSGSAAKMLYSWAHAEKRDFHERPEPGDLAFFRDTYGPKGTGITHVALVEKVDADGNVTLIHYLSNKVMRSRMNLAHPADPAVNGYLRKKDKPGTPLLSGQLFVAYARFAG